MVPSNHDFLIFVAFFALSITALKRYKSVYYKTLLDSNEGGRSPHAPQTIYFSYFDAAILSFPGDVYFYRTIEKCFIPLYS